MRLARISLQGVWRFGLGEGAEKCGLYCEPGVPAEMSARDEPGRCRLSNSGRPRRMRCSELGTAAGLVVTALSCMCEFAAGSKLGPLGAPALL